MERDLHPTKVKQPIYNRVDLICYGTCKGVLTGQQKKEARFRLS
jgi:hypothetical protein